MTTLSNIPLGPEWATHLSSEFDSQSMSKLQAFLNSKADQHAVIYPPQELIFSAFNVTPLSKVRVVILGQDPYHGAGQAHGLSFSVPLECRIPPSLNNILKELHTDLGCALPAHGNLTQWAEQGVFLLNSVLTVEHASAASHQKQGWEEFTDKVIALINDHCESVVFMLWGGYAQKKCQIIDDTKHLVLTAPHPSPLSSYRGFFGCQHFSKANAYLRDNGYARIDWHIK